MEGDMILVSSYNSGHARGSLCFFEEELYLNPCGEWILEGRGRGGSAYVVYAGEHRKPYDLIENTQKLTDEVAILWLEQAEERGR